MEASSPLGQSGQIFQSPGQSTGQSTGQNQAPGSVSARVVTRAFGLRLGGFGVDYSSKQVTVGPDNQTGSSQSDTRAQAFQTEMDRESLREQLLSATQTAGATGQSSTVSHPDQTWRTGLTAYAKARDQMLTTAARVASTTLAVA